MHGEVMDGATGLRALQLIQGAAERVHHLNLKQRDAASERPPQPTDIKQAAGADGNTAEGAKPQNNK